jgi:hypothetical protein
MERDYTDEAWREASARAAQKAGSYYSKFTIERITKQLPRDLRKHLQVRVWVTSSTISAEFYKDDKKIFECAVGKDLRIPEVVIAHLCAVV